MNVLEIKAAVRERDGFRCVECGMTNEEYVIRTGRSLDVHRLIPRSFYTLEGCITLCKPCHAHKPKRQPSCLMHAPCIMEFRALRTWIDRVESEARRLSLNRSAYIRLVVTQEMDRASAERLKTGRED